MAESTQNNTQTKSVEDRLRVLSELTSRIKLSYRLGLSNKQQDLYEVLNYPKDIDASDLITRWKRQPLARAIVDRPAEATWNGEVGLTDETDENTALEQAYKQLDKDLSLKSIFARVDRLAQLGEYAILLLGFDDTSAETWGQPVEQGERQLKYVRPVGQNHIKIDKTENDPSNPRFGKPRIYEIELQGVIDNKNDDSTLKVHHSRVIHIAFSLLEDDVKGEPVMVSLYNRLMDVDKLLGGDAEMFWRGARPGYAGQTQEGYNIGDNSEASIKEQLDEYEAGLRRFLLLEGTDLNSLDQQIADPQGHVTAQLQMISAATGIPLRILLGSERGELASSQDDKNWKTKIFNRRQEEAEPTIIRPFVDKMIEYGVLPGAGENGYKVSWSELFSISEKEQADISKQLAGAIKDYFTNPAIQAVLPFKDFLKYILKFDEDKINAITENADSDMSDELLQEAVLEQLQERLQQEPQPEAA